LGAALELARFGVPSILIEKHDGTSWHPKTRNFNTRTMEIARGWGPAVYKRLRSIDTPPGWKSPIRFLASATARSSADRFEGLRGPGPTVSPVRARHVVAGAHRRDPARRGARAGLVDVASRLEATRLVRGGADSDDDARIEVVDRKSGQHPLVAAPPSSRRTAPRASSAASSI
jgi:hypothetical protein